MILDYFYNRKDGVFEVSYVKENGHKDILNLPAKAFKTFVRDEEGTYTNWDGCKCRETYTNKPSLFDIMHFLAELDSNKKDIINGKTFPRVYAFDIETFVPETNEFPDPAIAKFPITTISIVSPELNCIVLGTRELKGSELEYIKSSFNNYLDNTSFFKTLKLETPEFKYIHFNTEEDMLRYFLKYIVAKVPILTGWNNIWFDWNYIYNRIKREYPDLSMTIASTTGRLHNQSFTNSNGDKITLPIPDHTLILDYMAVVRDEDFVVMPIKESYSLDYISKESLGVNKIEYEGTIQDLYNRDYPKYVYYNAIDSILVQLINYRFKTLDHIYMYSLYCTDKISRCFSKIATTEALVFNYFYEQGIKVVTDDIERADRGKLMGAYVKNPIPGLHEYICCNDFASLYPSTIRTCNLSFENYLGVRWKDDEIKSYDGNDNYVIIGPKVYSNIGSKDSPKAGRLVFDGIDYDALEEYKKDPNYFVSVNGCIYKNDKDYAFRKIQETLKANRDYSKYLGKKLDASVMRDLKHILQDKEIEYQEYPDDVVSALSKLNFDIHNSNDVKNISDKNDLYNILSREITYYSIHEHAMKLLMNSMYGGSSHVAFYWFNMNLANDVTGESRNLIHLMEQHIPEYIKDNWLDMKDIHKSLGVEIDHSRAKDWINNYTVITESQDPDAFHGTSYVSIVYGDTDSLYISYKGILETIKGSQDMTLAQKRDIIVKINTGFLDEHNRQYIKDYYDKRFGQSTHNFELETIARAGVWGDVKKRYAQILLWKDGTNYDIDNLPLKVKGLEIVKSSFPKLSREMLGKLFRFMLEHAGNPQLIHLLNTEMMKLKSEWLVADVEMISGSVKVNNYGKYIADDSTSQIVFNKDPKKPSRDIVTPWNVKALAKYNGLRNEYKLDGEPINGGKLKWYVIKKKNPKAVDEWFAYTASQYPKWAHKYAPIDRERMFQQTVVDPLNRILQSNNMPLLSSTGCIQISLF